MGLVHIPRSVVATARGYWRSRTAAPAGQRILQGIEPTNPHIYTSRAGLFDVDYLGHLNNAAFLSHAELARWEWAAFNGLTSVFLQEQAGFIAASTMIRYRREVRPLFRKFQVHTHVAALDDKYLWIHQNFRYPGEGGVNKIRAQLVLKQVIVQKGISLDPREFLADKFHISSDLIDQLDRTRKRGAPYEELLNEYEDLETSLRSIAAADDERLET